MDTHPVFFKDLFMRKRIFEIIEVALPGDPFSKIYDSLMMVTIVASLIPLTMKGDSPFWSTVEWIATVIFIIDYIARWATADYKLKKGAASYIRYPFTIMAIVDLLALLPTVSAAIEGLRMLKVLRLFRTFRIFKAVRYSKNLAGIMMVFKRQKEALLIVCCMAIGYILLSALIVFNVEPDTFGSYFDAVYWATVSLMTVGYGDICTVSVVGKVVAMISMLFGVAIVALPAGIVTAGYMEVLREQNIDVPDDIN